MTERGAAEAVEEGVESLRARLVALQSEFDQFREHLPDALVEADIASAQVTYLNRMATILFGYTAEDVAAGLEGVSMLSPEAARMVLETVQRHTAESFATGRPYERTGTPDLVQVTMVRKDGTTFPAEVQGSYRLDSAGIPRRVLFNIRDVSRRLEAEAKLRTTSERLAFLTGHAPVILFAVDAAGYLVECIGRGDWYESSERFDGIGRHVTDLAESYPAYAELLHALLAGGPISARFPIDQFVFDVRAEPVPATDGGYGGLVGVAVDASELARTEAALRQSQKLESLGQLAGGVAHDFNNILASVLGVVAMLRQSRGLDIADREGVEIIETAAQRGAEISARLLAFARDEDRPFEPTDLRAVCEEVRALVQHSLPLGVSLRLEMPGGPMLILGDAGQLAQAVLNLVLNARDAMPDGGEITVRVRRESGDALMQVVDTGTGMDAATAERVFEPFFTTKPVGSGTGLGTAIVWRIVEAHGGAVTLETAPGTGTSFVLRFPACESTSVP